MTMPSEIIPDVALEIGPLYPDLAAKLVKAYEKVHLMERDPVRSVDCRVKHLDSN